MPHTRHRLKSKARAALLWTLAVFTLGQVSLGLHVALRHSEMCDPEYKYRLRSLRARLAEAPGQPLALIVGSSRAANGFRPASIKQAAGATEPVLFNFAQLGCGPVRSLMVMRRLLADGIRPKVLFIEVWAPFLPQIGLFNEEHAVFEFDNEIRWVDVPLLSRLYRRGGEAFNLAVETATSPAVRVRKRLLDRYAPFLLTRKSASGENDTAYRTLDDSGWLPVTWERGSSEMIAVRAAGGRAALKPILDIFQVDKVSDTALRGLLDECRARHIRAVLVVMPEHSLLRSWYPPATNAALSSYLGRLRNEYSVPVIDARSWADDEDFLDCAHLLPSGARSFSQRFGRDVFAPLMTGHPLAPDTLLR